MPEPAVRDSGKRWPVALVTGASSGLGRALAVELAAGGTDLVLVARRRERLEDLAAELRTRHRRNVEVMVADLVDADQLGEVEGRLSDKDRPVDLLVNNAGIGTTGAFAELPLELEMREIGLNVVALVRLTGAALPGMVERRRGAILNMSSLAALQPLPYSATYSATKAYVTTFSEAVHTEVRASGVQVLALMPGFTRTEFQELAGVDRSMIPGPMWMSAEAVARSGLRALARGGAGWVPGIRYQVVAGLSRLTPWAVSRRITSRVSKKL